MELCLQKAMLGSGSCLLVAVQRDNAVSCFTHIVKDSSSDDSALVDYCKLIIQPKSNSKVKCLCITKCETFQWNSSSDVELCEVLYNVFGFFNHTDKIFLVYIGQVFTTEF